LRKKLKKIISHLDKLLEKLNVGKSEISEVGLDKLRNMYTMQSERDVHDRIAKKKPTDGEKEKENEDEVELF
jgi:hypothetical protein